jgi:serine/threonine-protein kinase
MPQPAACPEAGAFYSSLRISQLLPEAEVRTLEESCAPDGLPALYERLVAEKKLTGFQLNCVRRGEGHRLTVGSYRILDELGRGGVGQVYKARHGMMERVVALKVMRTDEQLVRLARDQFRREVAAITRLNHPNVALTFDANEINGTLYLAMEYVEGPTLQHSVTEFGPLPIPMACSVLLQTAQALQHAHENGIVHRDIKPGNLMLPGARSAGPGSADQPVLVKVVDFGLARLSPRDDYQLTTIQCKEGSTIGTPAFISPEQVQNVHAADIRSDLYSLGCTFYFALTGHLPFHGATASATLALQLEREPRDLRSLRREIPAPLAAIVQRMMCKKPADRFQTPAELVQALDNLILSGSLCDIDLDEAAPPRRQSRQPVPDGREDSLPTPPAMLSPRHGVRALNFSAAEAEAAYKKLRGLWCRWREVIENSIEGGPPSLRDADYKNLYRDLLAAARAAGVTRPAPFPDYLRQLQSVVEPWVSLNALTKLDRRTLAGLWDTCLSLEAKLWSPQLERQSKFGLLAAVVLFLGCSLGAYLWMTTDVSRHLPDVSSFERSPQSMAVGLLLPALALVFIFARSKGKPA